MLPESHQICVNHVWLNKCRQGWKFFINQWRQWWILPGFLTVTTFLIKTSPKRNYEGYEEPHDTWQEILFMKFASFCRKAHNKSVSKLWKFLERFINRIKWIFLSFCPCSYIGERLSMDISSDKCRALLRNLSSAAIPAMADSETRLQTNYSHLVLELIVHVAHSYFK